MPDRDGRRPAAGGVADAPDPPGAEGSRRAIFWAVRADGKSHLLRRATLDQRDHGDIGQPEGGHGGAGTVLRGRTGAIGKGAGLKFSRRPGLEPGSIRRAVAFGHVASCLRGNESRWLWAPAFAGATKWNEPRLAHTSLSRG